MNGNENSSLNETCGLIIDEDCDTTVSNETNNENDNISSDK